MKYERYDFKMLRIFSFPSAFVLQPLIVLQRRCSAAHFLSAGFNLLIVSLYVNVLFYENKLHNYRVLLITILYTFDN